MDLDQRLNARYQRALALGIQTTPNQRVAVGDGQEIEVVHVVADAFRTVLFARVHGGPGAEEPHFGPHLQGVDPPELAGPLSGTRWHGFEIAHFAAVLPFRRTITVACGPVLPTDAPPTRLQAQSARDLHRLPGRITVPVAPERAAAYTRTGSAGVVAQSAEVRIEALSFVAGLTGMQVVLRVEPTDLHFSPMPRAPHIPRDIPLGTPAALWREPAEGRQGVPRRVFRAVESGSGQSSLGRPVRIEPWQAIALPSGGVLLMQEGSSQEGRQILVFDAPPASATGVRLENRGVYRWEPVVALADIAAPDAQRRVELQGTALVWSTGRLDLVAWEPGETHATLVARPSVKLTAAPPVWLPDVRLIVGEGSYALPCTPRSDGTFTFSVPLAHVPGESVRLGVRAVGHRLPPIEIDLKFDR